VIEEPLRTVVVTLPRCEVGNCEIAFLVADLRVVEGLPEVVGAMVVAKVVASRALRMLSVVLYGDDCFAFWDNRTVVVGRGKGLPMLPSVVVANT
jgi:hypothetical protein